LSLNSAKMGVGQMIGGDRFDGTCSAFVLVAEEFEEGWVGEGIGFFVDATTKFKAIVKPVISLAALGWWGDTNVEGRSLSQAFPLSEPFDIFPAS